MKSPTDGFLKSHPRYWVLIIIVVVFACLLIAYFQGFFIESLCLVPPGTMVDSEEYAKVQTWNDLNGNGLQDNGEPPLPGVTVQMDGSSSTVNASGVGILNIFKPGCVCNCWKGETIEALIPFGYKPTTPIKISLTGDQTIYHFGFQLLDSAQP
jgi:hypothetical protein